MHKETKPFFCSQLNNLFISRRHAKTSFSRARRDQNFFSPSPPQSVNWPLYKPEGHSCFELCQIFTRISALKQTGQANPFIFSLLQAVSWKLITAFHLHFHAILTVGKAVRNYTVCMGYPIANNFFQTHNFWKILGGNTRWKIVFTKFEGYNFPCICLVKQTSRRGSREKYLQTNE